MSLLRLQPWFIICPHWLWRDLEPHVRQCRICRLTEFDAGATNEQLERWLLGNPTPLAPDPEETT